MAYSWFGYMVLGLLGLSVGSFLNVVIYRFNTQSNPWVGRSHCMKCGQELAWYDLIPVISFIILLARCRYCKTPISWQYFWVEISTSLLFMFFWYIMVSEEMLGMVKGDLIKGGILVGGIVLLCQLIIVFVYDALYMRIPEVSLKIIQMLGILFILSYRISTGVWYSGIFTAIFLASLFMLIYVLSKKQSMGFGDIELIAGLGLFIPLGLAWWFFLGSCMFGTLWGLAIVIIKKEHDLKVRMAFGPSIILSFITMWGLLPYWAILHQSIALW